MDNVKVADDYKDRLFRMIFNDKEKLLELYNAMNRSDDTDASELQVVTLVNITVRQSRQSGVARATCPD